VASEPIPPQPSKINLKLLLKLGISLTLLVVVFQKIGFEQTLNELKEANLAYLPLCILIYISSQLVSAYRWQFLASVLQFRLALREFFDYYMMGMFFSLFLPGAIGGDVGRMVYLAKRTDRKKREALMTILAERGVGLIALLLLTASLSLMPFAEPVPYALRLSLWLGGLGMLVGYFVMRILPLEPLAQRFPRLELFVNARPYWQDVPLLVKSVLLSFLVHACMGGIHVLIANALGISVSFPYLLMIYGMVSLVSVLPIAFNGIGVREGAYVYLLGLAGVSAHQALAFGVYWFLVSSITSLVGGLILVRGHYKTPSVASLADS
jgi:uncharacterized membrane protein YbhN (UPF0104 family)